MRLIINDKMEEQRKRRRRRRKAWNNVTYYASSKGSHTLSCVHAHSCMIHKHVIHWFRD